MHWTGPCCTSIHKFRVMAVFYPDLYPERRHSQAETLYLLVAGTSRSIPTEHTGNLPSWSCGFDSRRPLYVVRTAIAHCNGSPGDGRPGPVVRAEHEALEEPAVLQVERIGQAQLPLDLQDRLPGGGAPTYCAASW